MNKEIIESIIEYLENTYQIVSEMPSRNIKEDNFILYRLEGAIRMLKEVNND